MHEYSSGGHRSEVCGKKRQSDLVLDADVTVSVEIGSVHQVGNGIKYEVNQINQKSTAVGNLD